MTNLQARSRMHHPPHPGEVLRDTVLGKEGDVTVNGLATHLRISRARLARVIDGRAAIDADMAIRLAAALGGSAESWLRMQISYDLWHAQRTRHPRINPLKARRPKNLAEYFASSPLRQSGLKIKRSKNRLRSTDL